MTRIVKYDILRIIASFSIVLLHVSASYWSVVDLHGKEFLVMTIYNSMTRFAVPVFFMLSGLFLVSPRRENPMAGKRILKLVMLFYVWSAFYAFQRIAVDTLKGDFSMEVWRAALERFIFGHVHMWFLQILCGFYLRWALFLSWQDTWDMNIGGCIWKKCRVLLLPYFLWNLFYGVLAQVLHGIGFSLGEVLPFRTLFLSPFIDGHQFLYNFSAWFVPTLFLVEIINVLMRKILGVLRLKYEWLIFIVSLVVGMVTIQLAIGGHVWGIYKFPGRLLLMFPGFQMGKIYKEKIETYDTLPDGIYFLIVIGVQILISIFNAGLAFGVVWVTSFANGFAIPYLTVVTGIAFWLRIAKLISEMPVGSGKLVTVGRNTYSIMMHHVAVFMLIKGIFYLYSSLTPLCAEFDRELFFHDINYVYLAGGTEASKWIYLLSGIAVPLLINEMLGKVKIFVGKLISTYGRGL